MNLIKQKITESDLFHNEWFFLKLINLYNYTSSEIILFET